jgi:hypothetical protein
MAGLLMRHLLAVSNALGCLCALLGLAAKDRR